MGNYLTKSMKYMYVDMYMQVVWHCDICHHKKIEHILVACQGLLCGNHKLLFIFVVFANASDWRGNSLQQNTWLRFWLTEETFLSSFFSRQNKVIRDLIVADPPWKITHGIDVTEFLFRVDVGRLSNSTDFKDLKGNK